MVERHALKQASSRVSAYRSHGLKGEVLPKNATTVEFVFATGCVQKMLQNPTHEQLFSHVEMPLFCANDVNVRKFAHRIP